MKMKYKNRLIEVLWNDSFSHGVGWRDIESRQEIPDNVALIKSVGYFISESKKWLTMCQSVSEDAGGLSVHHTFSIPQSCIERITKLD